MCKGDDQNCPDFELHRKKLLDELDSERRSFLKSAFVATGGAAALVRGRHAGRPGVGADASPGPAQPSLSAGDGRHGALGLLQQAPEASVEVDIGDYVTIEALTHHANDDAERMVKGDPGAESVYPLDQGQEGREPARRRSDRRQAARTRRRRGLRRAHLHRSGLRPRRRARRHPRSAHHGREAAALRQSGLSGQGLRQQRGRLVGLPLQGPAHRAEAARGQSRSTRSTPPDSATGRRRSTISNGRRRPIRSASSTRPSTIPACRSTTARSRRTTAS